MSHYGSNQSGRWVRFFYSLFIRFSFHVCYSSPVRGVVSVHHSVPGFKIRECFALQEEGSVRV